MQRRLSTELLEERVIFSTEFMIAVLSLKWRRVKVEQAAFWAVFEKGYNFILPAGFRTLFYHVPAQNDHWFSDKMDLNVKC